MRRLNLIRFFAGALLILGALSAHAFTTIRIPPALWPNTTIPMNLKFGPPLPAPLKDGARSFNAVATNALGQWNQHLKTIKFTSTISSPGGASIADGLNQTFFDSDIYGVEFDPGTLAVTFLLIVDAEILEADVVFNTEHEWNSYRGPIQFQGGEYLADFYRVALHEFGHVLGLDHPDEVGQNVPAMMNSSIDDLDHLTKDDIDGATFLYGGAPKIIAQPVSQAVVAGAPVTFSVEARGLGTLFYQWFFGEEAIVGANEAEYTIARVQSAQTGTYTVVITNTIGSVTSLPATLTISSDTAFGVVGAPFSYQIVANNRPTWHTATGLPSGVTLNNRTGFISGIPTRTGRFIVQIRASNTFGSISGTIAFTIADGVITSSTLARGIIGVPFNYQIAADNKPDFHTASGLPAGLRLNNTTGLISGVPTRTGTFYIPVKASNDWGTAATNVVISIAEGAIVSPSLALGVVGAPFSFQLAGNFNPFWGTVSGLPPGLGFDGTTGIISGTPTRTGSTTVTIRASNQYTTVTSTLTINIVAGRITSPSILENVIGVPFTYEIAANNVPNWFTATGLPDGLKIDGALGLISGTPVEIGSFEVVVKASNRFATASDTITILITAGRITSGGVAEAIVGVPFNYQITADNNAMWFTASGLPPGLGVDGTTGMISGTPNEAGASVVQLKASNLFATAASTLRINIPDDGEISGSGSPLKITFAKSANGLVLKWPAASTGFILEETQSPFSGWNASNSAVVVQGNENVAVITTSGTAKFYRLRK